MVLVLVRLRDIVIYYIYFTSPCDVDFILSQDLMGHYMTTLKDMRTCRTVKFGLLAVLSKESKRIT